MPYPFTSREAYERSMRAPIGPEYNTDEAFRNLTRPAVSLLGLEGCTVYNDGDGDDDLETVMMIFLGLCDRAIVNGGGWDEIFKKFKGELKLP